MAQHNDIGKWGEQVAVESLIVKGYAIVARNHRVGNLEIDIIASKGDKMVFVEVKTRTNPNVDPTDAIDLKRMRRMATAANSFIRSHNLRHYARLDVIAITGTEGSYKIEHFEDAFRPPLRTR